MIAYVFIKEDNIDRTKVDNGGWDNSSAVPINDSSDVFTGWFIVKLEDSLNDLYKDYCKFDESEATTNIQKARDGTLLRADTYCPYLLDTLIAFNEVPSTDTSSASFDVSGYNNLTITYELVNPSGTSVRVKGLLTDSNVDVGQLESVLTVNQPKAVISLPNFSGQTLKFALSDVTNSADNLTIKIRGRW